MKQPTKAIICAAGMGTRFLPQTKAMPKEMLPIIDKPIIQLIVEEAVKAGVTDVIIITGSTKRAVEDHFDRSVELEDKLRCTGKAEMADKLQAISELANFIYIRQKGTGYGTALPVLEASHLIEEDEPFFVFFPDDYFRSETAWPSQLVEAYNKTGKSTIALVEIDKKDAGNYGMVEVGEEASDRVFKLKSFVEKPGPDKTPSNLASAGSFLLTADILPILANVKEGPNGEIMLKDAFIELIKSDAIYGCSIEGVYHDTGDHLKYIQTIVDEALVSPKYGQQFEKYLRDRLCQ
jgi:UTP--glucose-1-phosphate uridylyltransferase